VVFAGGVAWLTVMQPAHSLRAALAAGFYPFVLADVAKLFAAASVMPALWRQTGREPFRRA
jgi:biotin transporter BioY